jgi:hypothetical protein
MPSKSIAIGNVFFIRIGGILLADPFQEPQVLLRWRARQCFSFFPHDQRQCGIVRRLA